jgi:oxygen-independent coproporphyrinogen-3 oxidase
MQGIYLHIPFCKQACHYCDFHFSTSLKYKTDLINALHREIELRKNYLKGNAINSIYFGGGTPSLLSVAEIEGLLNTIAKYFSFDNSAEITLEANPDDISTQKVNELKQAGINRLSIGIQSFFEEDLVWMNRAHSAPEAETCIDIALQSGIENITADLIYGYSLLSDEKWASNIEKMLSSGVNHLSAYSLTVEPKTALAHQIQKGTTPAPIAEKAALHFEMLMDAIALKEWTHYEISNYCKTDNYALHNTNYWKNKPYLGLGPSAHSYNGTARQWNIANNAQYIKKIEEGILPAEAEKLTAADTYNEYVMTGLRTMWGISLEDVVQSWGAAFAEHLKNEVQPFIANDEVRFANNTFTLTQKGKLLADYIAGELFWLN